jgi:hypothetical protein
MLAMEKPAVRLRGAKIGSASSVVLDVGRERNSACEKGNHSIGLDQKH